MRRTMLAAVALCALAFITLTGGAHGAREANCSRACVERVKDRIVKAQRERVRAKWRRTVAPYRAVLSANVDCESRSSGGYRLATTGNGYWFAHQFDVQAWTGAGGRYAGRPVGRWSTQPGRLEQDYRAIVWDRIHGGDPWPNCPLG